MRVRDDIRASGSAISIAQIEAELRDQLARQQKAAARLSRWSKKCWLDFFDGRDQDLADRAYASYLHDCGFSLDEIRLTLVAESEDIYVRKHTDIGAYLDVTVGTVLAPTEPQGTDPTVPEKRLDL